MTKREIAYAVLRERANEWVSGNLLVEAGVGWRYAARVEELRKAGHTIESPPRSRWQVVGRPVPPRHP